MAAPSQLARQLTRPLRSVPVLSISIPLEGSLSVRMSAGTAEDAVLPWAFAADADRWAAAASARPRGARLVMVVLCRLPERRRPRASRAARPSWLSAQSAARCAERGPSAAAPSASSDAVPRCEDAASAARCARERPLAPRLPRLDARQSARARRTAVQPPVQAAPRRRQVLVRPARTPRRPAVQRPAPVRRSVRVQGQPPEASPP